MSSSAQIEGAFVALAFVLLLSGFEPSCAETTLQLNNRQPVSDFCAAIAVTGLPNLLRPIWRARAFKGLARPRRTRSSPLWAKTPPASGGSAGARPGGAP